MSLLTAQQLDLTDEGYASELTALNSSVIYTTVYGHVVGWDLRAPGVAWRLESKPRHGLISAMCMDRGGSWLVTGSSSGVLTCWDLRFRLPISNIVHSAGSRIRRVIPHPGISSCILTACQGNNEIAAWNMETQQRELTLWASPNPPLVHSQVKKLTTKKNP